jgi:tetratricopeptide (TPR) repeat protein
VTETHQALVHAEALCDLRRYQEALALLSRAVASDPDNPRAWCLMARAQLGLRRHAEALQAANAAVALAPDYEWPHRLASIALEEQGNHWEAVRAAREAVRLAPHTWQAHVRLAHAGIQAWGMDQARVAAERALTLAPGVADTHIAAAAAAAGDRREAEAHLRRALAIEPDSAVAHNELARLHLRQAHAANPAGLARAAKGFATAVRSDPRASVSRHNLDVVVRAFLGRAAYGVWLGTYLIVRLDTNVGPAAARIAALALLAVLSLFVWGFVGRLTADLRRYLVRELLGRRLRLAAGLDVLAVCCLLAGPAAPIPLSVGLLAAAPLAALAARVLLWREARAARA